MINLKEQVDMSNCTLIVPSVAVGNVGQLTVDLLISSLGLRRIGSIFNSAFIPILGPDPYYCREADKKLQHNDSQKSTISSAIDIYLGVQEKMVVLQIRSLVTEKPTLFFDELINFVREKNISDVIILTSSHDHEKTDPQIQTTTPLRYLATEGIELKYHEIMASNLWVKLEKKKMVEACVIPGGGFAKDLFEAMQNEHIECAILLKFCSEGDNIPDALSLLHYLNQLVPILLHQQTKENVKIVYPSSWKFLFGNAPPLEIY